MFYALGRFKWSGERILVISLLAEVIGVDTERRPNDFEDVVVDDYDDVRWWLRDQDVLLCYDLKGS